MNHDGSLIALLEESSNFWHQSCKTVDDILRSFQTAELQTCKGYFVSISQTTSTWKQFTTKKKLAWRSCVRPQSWPSQSEAHIQTQDQRPQDTHFAMLRTASAPVNNFQKTIRKKSNKHTWNKLVRQTCRTHLCETKIHADCGEHTDGGTLSIV